MGASAFRGMFRGLLGVSVLFIGLGVFADSSNSEKTNKKILSISASTNVAKYLEDTLKVEEPARFLLTEDLKQQLIAGFEGTGNKAFAEGSELTAEGRAALMPLFNEISAANLEKVILALARPEYSNAMVIGPAGAGKTFLSNQIKAILSFGLVPDFLREEMGLDSQTESAFLKGVRESFFERTQMVQIDHDLLSQDNTRSGKAFAKSEVRMRSLLHDLFAAAKQDFRQNGIRTVFVLEEVATLPPLVQQTLKSLLDQTGYKGKTEDPLERGQEIGISVIGMTTPDEYRAMVGSDSATERRYEHVFILEPSEAQALKILQNKKDRWFDRYGYIIEDNVLAYLISMRKFFSNPPLAMPHSVIKVVDGLMLWATNSKNRKNGEEITIGEAYEYLIEQSHLPKETWVPDIEGKPPLWDLGERVKKHVVGHDQTIDQIVRRMKTGRSTGFREFQVFIIMGPSGSGKDTLARAINKEMFGHDGRHLQFDVAGSHGAGLRAILEGASLGSSGDREMPLLIQALNNGPPNGLIVFNEAKDLPSDQFDKLKTLIEDGVIRPRGRDSRARPLGLNVLFVMGQYGEELFEGKSEAEYPEILQSLSESDLVKILERGRDNGTKGAIPYAVIQRAIRSGGVFMLPPVSTNRYIDIVRLNLKEIVDNLKTRSHLEVDVDESLVEFVANESIVGKKGTRGLDGVLKDLTETAISEAVDQGLPMWNVSLKLAVDKAKGEVVIKHVVGDTLVKEYRNPVTLLLRTKCMSLLQP